MPMRFGLRLQHVLVREFHAPALGKHPRGIVLLFRISSALGDILGFIPVTTAMFLWRRVGWGHKLHIDGLQFSNAWLQHVFSIPQVCQHVNSTR